MKIGTVRALACVGLGTMLAFIAATRDFRPSVRADGAMPATRQDGAGSGATCQGVDKPTGCSEGVARHVLLAQAGAETARAKTSSNSSGKKPNIVFIMSDDVGLFNIGAYHRGIMAGKTPHLD